MCVCVCVSVCLSVCSNNNFRTMWPVTSHLARWRPTSGSKFKIIVQSSRLKWSVWHWLVINYTDVVCAVVADWPISRYCCYVLLIVLGIYATWQNPTVACTLVSLLLTPVRRRRPSTSKGGILPRWRHRTLGRGEGGGSACSSHVIVCDSQCSLLNPSQVRWQLSALEMCLSFNLTNVYIANI